MTAPRHAARGGGGMGPRGLAVLLLALVVGAMAAGFVIPAGPDLAGRLLTEVLTGGPPTSSAPPAAPRTSDRMLRPTAGPTYRPCPPGFGYTPELPSVCVSPVPDVLRRMPRTTTPGASTSTSRSTTTRTTTTTTTGDS